MKHQHTIILVPHARAKFRKLRFTTLQAALVLGALAVLTIGGVVATVSYFSASIDRQQLTSIEHENAELQRINANFEGSIRQLEDQLGSFQARIRDLAIVAGLSDPPAGAETGIGGLAPAETAVEDLTEHLSLLKARADDLGEGVTTLQNRFAERDIRIASTPAIAPVRGLISSSFGYRRDPFTQKRARHNGLDIIARKGTPVHATGDAIVTRAGRLGNLGNAIYLSHGYGITTRYGHLSRIAATPGQTVHRGDVIGYVGSTGRSSGYHLHYEVRIDGRPTDPRAYLLDRHR